MKTNFHSLNLIYNFCALKNLQFRFQEKSKCILTPYIIRLLLLLLLILLFIAIEDFKNYLISVTKQITFNEGILLDVSISLYLLISYYILISHFLKLHIC